MPAPSSSFSVKAWTDSNNKRRGRASVKRGSTNYSMNITIKITHPNGTVTDICIPINEPVTVSFPEPVAVPEEEPACAVEPDDILPSGKRYKSVQEMVEANSIFYGPEVLECLKEALKDEPEQPQDAGDQFRCTDGFYAVPPNLYSDFCAAFGKTMVDQQLTLARLWVETNPPKRKTRRGMGRFLNAWMCRAQGEKRVPLNSRGSLLDAAPSRQEGW